MAFVDAFRAILYDNRLPFGAKCLAFALLDVPPGAVKTNAKLARKLHVPESSVSRWRKLLETTPTSVDVLQSENSAPSENAVVEPKPLINC
jgi:hypothetical protein